MVLEDKHTQKKGAVSAPFLSLNTFALQYIYKYKQS
jgi:hypothetical protein